MAKINSFEELDVWKNARLLAKKIFELIKEDSFSRDFKLVNQINASSGSIMDNIAEGFERNGTREFIQFLSIAKGSAGETRSQLYRALDREYLSDKKFKELIEDLKQISGQLSNLIKYLKNSEMKGVKYVNELETLYEVKAK